MIEQNLIDVNVVKNISSKYFAHYKTKEENHEIYRNDPFSRKFIENYEELSRNNWELHKKYVKEGHNPNELAQIIRNDEIEKLQEISSQSDFDFNQIIEPSLYERCSYVNHENVTLIDYAAFFSAVKCFKYLLMNNANVENTGKYAVAGGNLEIIHLCEQNHLSFEDAYKTAIEFHRNDVFKYIYENKTETSEENFNYLAYNCINSGNYEILGFLEKEAVKINEYIINESARSGNLYLVKDFLQNNQIPKDILCFSSKSGNLELVKYILEQEGVDINAKDKDGYTALTWAILREHIEIVKILLEQEGIDINTKDRWNGMTPLMKSSWSGKVEIVKLLLRQKGIDVNAKSNGGKTALIWASEKGYNEIVKIILKKKGIDVNAKDNIGQTALIYVSKNGNIEIVKLLLKQKGIDINSKSNDGKFDVFRCFLEIIQIK